jgi:hypothetical protein
MRHVTYTQCCASRSAVVAWLGSHGPRLNPGGLAISQGSSKFPSPILSVSEAT